MEGDEEQWKGFAPRRKFSAGVQCPWA